MTRQERQQFVNDLIDNCRESILTAVEHMPDNWNGTELREYIADHFKRQTGHLDRSRRKAYNNEITTNQHL